MREAGFWEADWLLGLALSALMLLAAYAASVLLSRRRRVGEQSLACQK